jgi:hypothetical protein
MDENLNPVAPQIIQPVLTPKPKRSHKVLIFILLPTLLLLGAGVYFYSINSNKQLADIAPIDDSFMRVEPVTVAPEDNAYSELIKLEGILVSASTSPADFSVAKNYLSNENPSIKDIEEVKSLLNKNKQAFEIFEKTKIKPKYSCTSVDGVCHLNDLRNIALLKTVDAKILREMGKNQEAMEELFEVLDLNTKLKRGTSSLIITLVHLAIEKPVLVEIQKIMESEKLTSSDKTRYLEKIKTYPDDRTVLKNAYKAEYKYQTPVLDTLDALASQSLPEEEKEILGTFADDWKLKDKHTWKLNETKLLNFNLYKSYVENVDRPCGTDYDKYSAPFLIDEKTLTPTDENYLGKLLHARRGGPINNPINKMCELLDLKNKIETSLAQ